MHSFIKSNQLINNNETHFNSKQPLETEIYKVIFRPTILLLEITI